MEISDLKQRIRGMPVSELRQLEQTYQNAEQRALAKLRDVIQRHTLVRVELDKLLLKPQ